jgi:SAM-dependent methyltransferase/uncharacterized small protein (DUF1192 family)
MPESASFPRPVLDRVPQDPGSSATADAELAQGGERFVPADPHMGADTRQEHLLRYHAAAPLVAGRRVLDAACGEGYGAAILAGTARAVVGMDLSAAAVRHAQTTYADAASAAGRVSFVTGTIAELPFPDASFDAVVSFETIEHVDAEAQHRFVREIVRVLKPDGLLIISTPNRINYSERPGQRNPFHLHELDPEEFRTLLAPLTIFRLYAQSVMAFSAIWRAGETGYAFHGELRADDLDDTFLIAVCGRPGAAEPAPSLAALSYDPGLSHARLRATLAEKERWIAALSEWGAARDRSVAERDARIVQLQEEVVRLGVWGQGLERSIKENHAVAAATVGQRDQRIAQLQDDVARLAAWGRSGDERVGQRDARIVQLQDEVARLGEWGRAGDAAVAERDARIVALTAENARLATGRRDAETAQAAGAARIVALQEEVLRLGAWGRAGDVAVAERDARITELQAEVLNLAEWGQRGDRAVLERETEIAGLRDDLRQRGDAVAARERELAEATARMNDLLIDKARLEAAWREETMKGEIVRNRLARVPWWLRWICGAGRQ